MHSDVLIAGFGGQGVLLAGKLLAWAGMLGGRHVTWFPSYGAEMRGGTANCTVIISEHEIGSPVVDRPFAFIGFNQASADKFSARVARGGLVVLNSSLVKRETHKAGTRVVRVPANELAAELGNTRTVNMIMLGAYVKASGAVRLDSVKKAVKETLGAKDGGLLPLNIAALERGFDLAR